MIPQGNPLVEEGCIRSHQEEGGDESWGTYEWKAVDIWTKVEGHTRSNQIKKEQQSNWECLFQYPSIILKQILAEERNINSTATLLKGLTDKIYGGDKTYWPIAHVSIPATHNMTQLLITFVCIMQESSNCLQSCYTFNWIPSNHQNNCLQSDVMIWRQKSQVSSEVHFRQVFFSIITFSKLCATLMIMATN